MFLRNDLAIRPTADEGAVLSRADDRVSIRQAHEESAVAHCPLCRAALVARQGRAGPYFFCACSKGVKAESRDITSRDHREAGTPRKQPLSDGPDGRGS